MGVELVSIVTFTSVGSVQVDAIAITADTSHEAFVDVFAVLLVASHHEALMAVASEASTISDIGAHSVVAVVGILALVEVHALGVVDLVEHHSLVTTAVEASFEVVAHTSVAWVRSAALVDVCACFLSVHSLLFVSRIAVTGVAVDGVDTFSLATLVR